MRSARNAISLLVGLALAAAPATLSAHGVGVLKSARSSVEAGSVLPVQGSAFEKELLVELVLVGALGEYPLLEVGSDTAGAFTLDLQIPAQVRPGQYQLIAIAPDGDRAGTLDLMIMEAVASTAAAGADEHAGHDMGGEAMARADEMSMPRSWSGAEWGAIGLLIGLAGGVGLMLLRRNGA